jgi:hypothetical protein
MLSEEQAKMKWCPFARDSETAGNRSQLTGHIAFTCFGSGCMAWRWGPHTERQDVEKTEEQPSDAVKIWTEKETQEEADIRREGYCGLAGATNG